MMSSRKFPVWAGLLMLCYLLVSQSPLSIAGKTIGNAFGLQLGMDFDPATAADTEKGSDGTMLFLARELTDDPYFSKVFVALTAERQIYRIVARSPRMKITDCTASQQQLLQKLHTSYRDAGYYAAGDSDMFYQDQLTVILSCEGSGDSSVLVQDHVHEPLSKKVRFRGR